MGNWKIFSLKMLKNFQFLSSPHTKPTSGRDGKLITAKVQFRLDECWEFAECRFGEGKKVVPWNFVFLAQAQKRFPASVEVKNAKRSQL
jgi:hypothetical protein